jgi:prepilin peptidase dependent protein B
MQTARFRQRGLSLVELILGLAVGLWITAAAGSLLTAQLRDYRAIVREIRLTQDLRAAADLVARDLRRAGYWGHAGAAGSNPYADLDIGGTDASAGKSAGAVALRYSMDPVENDLVDTNEQFGFRLQNGAIELQLGAGNWQPLTDPAQLTVTAFSLTPELQDIALAAFCPTPCSAATGCTPPHQQQRSITVEIAARPLGDASVTRSVRSTVRVRSDAVVGRCAA